MSFQSLDFFESDTNNKSMIIFIDPSADLSGSELKKIVGKRFSPQRYLSNQNKKQGEIVIISKAGGSKIYYCVVQKHMVMKATIENYQTCINLVKTDVDANGITEIIYDDKFALGPSTKDVTDLMKAEMPSVTFTKYIM